MTMTTTSLQHDILTVIKQKRLSQSQKQRIIRMIEARLGSTTDHSADVSKMVAEELKTARENDSAIARKTHHRIKETTDAVLVVAREVRGMNEKLTQLLAQSNPQSV